MATVYGAVLHRWTGDLVIVIGTPASLRDDDDLDATVGLLLNSVPLVTGWSDNPAFADAVMAVRDTANAALRRRECPLDLLVEQLRPARADGRSPIFQVFFTLVPEPPALPSFGSGPARELPPPSQPAKFELSLDITAGDRMRCDLQWNPRRCTPQAAAAFLLHLRIACERIIADPDQRVGDWPLAEPAGPAITDPAAADPARVLAPFFC
jgi:non-ribosomal peptide synthetase component F